MPRISDIARTHGTCPICGQRAFKDKPLCVACHKKLMSDKMGQDSDLYKDGVHVMHKGRSLAQ